MPDRRSGIKKNERCPNVSSSCAECVEFLSQRRSGPVLMESRHEKRQSDKQGLYQKNKE